MKSLVIGMGQVGQALYDVLSDIYEVTTRDIVPDRHSNGIECIHICYPYTDDFVQVTADYIQEYSASLCIIHSTVVPGTTGKIQKQTICDVAYSPIRGRHGQMQADLLRYIKFVGAPAMKSTSRALHYLRQAGFRVGYLANAKVLELAKLIETTYSGLLIGWTQEMQRYCDTLDVDLADALTLTDEVDYLPKYEFYPGYIGGHCIMPNLDLLKQVKPSDFAVAIQKSNEGRYRQAVEDDEDLSVRHIPQSRVQ